MGHDFLTSYSVKTVEYLIAVSFLLLFVPFWRFVNARVATEAVPATAPGWLGQMVEWFRVPEQLHFHPGHAWARVGADNLVTVGVDDFASKLVGRPSTLRLPEVGSRIAQGERAWSLTCDGKTVDMLAPVDGTVVAVNPRVATSPGLITDDPYGDGWLVKVTPGRIGANLKELLSGRRAQRWIEEACEGLNALMSPEMGRVLQDGGVPADGMARNLDPVHWDDLARRFLLT
jgi:glycine cleavage system H lipoate-binding protein